MFDAARLLSTNCRTRAMQRMIGFSERVLVDGRQQQMKSKVLECSAQSTSAQPRSFARHCGQLSMTHSLTAQLHEHSCQRISAFTANGLASTTRHAADKTADAAAWILLQAAVRTIASGQLPARPLSASAVAHEGQRPESQRHLHLYVGMHAAAELGWLGASCKHVGTHIDATAISLPNALAHASMLVSHSTHQQTTWSRVVVRTAVVNSHARGGVTAR